MMRKIFVFFAGLVIILLLLEAGLRLIGFMHFKTLPQRPVSPAGNEAVILCLGDSFTYGIGADKEESYPRQLEKLFDDKFGKGRVEVINMAYGGPNTAMVLEQARKAVKEYGPDIVVLLAGGQNEWNFWGFKDSAGRSILVNLRDILYRVRVYKLARFLYENLTGRKNKKVEQDVPPNIYGNIYPESAVLKEKEDTFVSFDFWQSPQILRTQKDAQASPEYIKKSFFHCSEGVESYRRGNFEEAKNHFSEALKLNPGLAAACHGMGIVYRDSGEFKKAIGYFKKELEELAEISVIYTEIANCYQMQQRFLEAIEWYKKGIEVNPENFHNYRGIADSFYNLDEYGQAIPWYEKAIGVNRYDFESYRGLVICCLKAGRQKEGLRFLKSYKNTSPDIEYYIRMLRDNTDLSERLKDWVARDITEIIRICRQAGARVILQNYPIKHTRRIPINRILPEIARDNGVIFVNQYRIFKGLSSSLEIYLSSDEGHLNGEGYGIMARNVFEKILEEKLIVSD